MPPVPQQEPDFIQLSETARVVTEPDNEEEQIISQKIAKMRANLRNRAEHARLEEEQKE